MKLIACAVSLAMICPGVAAADDAEAPPPSPFITLARHDVTSHVDADVGYMFVNDSDGWAARLHLFGQYIHPDTGLGLYATVPFTHVSDGSHQDQLGAVELGGVFVPRLGLSYASLIVHAGVSLPTVTDDTLAGLNNFFVSIMRLNDAYAQFPKSTTFRVGVSPTVHSGPWFARFDASANINLTSPNDVNLDPAFELGVGVGVHLDKATLTAEVSDLTFTGVADDDTGSLDTIAVSAQYDTGKLTPYLAVVMGLDNDVRDLMDAAIMVGVRGGP